MQVAIAFGAYETLQSFFVQVRLGSSRRLTMDSLDQRTSLVVILNFNHLTYYLPEVSFFSHLNLSILEIMIRLHDLSQESFH